MKQILIFLVFLAGLYAANIYVNGEKVGGDDQNSTYNGESKNKRAENSSAKKATRGIAKSVKGPLWLLNLVCQTAVFVFLNNFY